MTTSRRRPAVGEDEDELQPVRRRTGAAARAGAQTSHVRIQAVDEDPAQIPGRSAQDRRPQHASVQESPAAGPSTGGGPPKKARRPLYPRLLRLQHIEPNVWQRAALGEGAVGAGVLLAMADLATAWSIVALPVAVAVVVKAHDVLQGLLERGGAPTDT